MAGTYEIGLQGKDDSEWAIQFNSVTFDSYLFATDDFKHWAILPKASISAVTVSAGEMKTITSSSVSSIPQKVTLRNFDGSSPTFKLDDANTTNENMFKASGSAITSAERSYIGSNVGMEVYIGHTGVTCVKNASVH